MALFHHTNPTKQKQVHKTDSVFLETYNIINHRKKSILN